MKLINQIVLLTILCLTSIIITNCNKASNKNGYTITGTVKGVDNEWVKIIRPNYTDRDDRGKVIDSALVQNGIFVMKGKTDQIDILSMTIGDKYASMRGFFVENSPINLTIDLGKADKYGQFEPEVSGSKSHDLYALQEAKDRRIMSQEKYAPLIALREEMSQAYATKDEALILKVKEKADKLALLSDERQTEYQNAKIDYVLKNPESPVSPYVLSFQFSEGRMTKERMQEVYNAFDGDAKNTAMFAYFAKTYKEIFESLAVGSTVPDFTLKTVEGNDLTLSEVKAKFILIDFWASWCVPCRASFPHLKELYAKYKNDGFNVVAIATADVEEKWRKAIEEDETVWNHVFDSAGEKERKGAFGSVAKVYGVPFLPTTFLIDEKGVIVGRQLDKEELDQKLADLFGY